MAQIELNPPKITLAFNPARTLVGVFRSIRSAAEMVGGHPQAISNACTGKVITSSGYYWRHENDEVSVEFEDIGVLSLEEYDHLCHEQRKYLKSKNIKGRRTIPLKNTNNGKAKI